MLALPRLLVVCVVGASSMHIDDVKGDERRVLLLGCSLDRDAVHNWCDHNGVKPYAGTEPTEAAWCFSPDLNVRMGYLFHPGVGLNGDLKKPNAMNRGMNTGAIISHFANKTSAVMLKADPHMVVVDSSLWDLFGWRFPRFAVYEDIPDKPREVTEERVQKWCKQDLLKLLDLVSVHFPNSRVVFRTAPTIHHEHYIAPHFAKFTAEEIEMMYTCISESAGTDGLLFGTYEIIDYHAIVQKLIDAKMRHLFRDDGYHPSVYPSLLYANEVLRRVGVDVPDPSPAEIRSRASKKAVFEAAVQGDSNDLDLI